MRNLYPEIEAFKAEYLKVSPTHEVYFEQCGNPDGKPILFLHGGPGSGTTPKHRRFFDPAYYRIILIDQRGAGKSKPRACLEENGTWELVHDIEMIRKHLGIRDWIVFGGSWGSTLALSYAIKCPTKVNGLILRGIFLARAKEISWLYQEGASYIYPDNWEAFLKPIPPEERENMVEAYYKRLTSEDEKVRLEAALAWSNWEESILQHLPKQENTNGAVDLIHAENIARIECHYFKNAAFFETDNYILENIEKIRHIPAFIAQGRYDLVCPTLSAWELHKAWPESNLKIIPDAGHSVWESGILDSLLEATDAAREGLT